jgi:hypothetical protein
MVDSNSRPPAMAKQKKKPKRKIQPIDKRGFTIAEVVESSTIGETSLCKGDQIQAFGGSQIRHAQRDPAQ